jgi:hypothetical protein
MLQAFFDPILRVLLVSARVPVRVISRLSLLSSHSLIFTRFSGIPGFWGLLWLK